jgi:MFS family permease
MLAALPAVVALLLGVTLLTIGNALLGTVVSLRMTVEGFSRLESGLVMGAYFAGLVLGSVLGARIVDRVGHIRAFAAFAATCSVSALAQSLWVGPGPWIGLRLLVGFSIAGELMVAESWLNARATSQNRGRIFSIYMIAIFLAFGGGQFLLAVGDPAEAELFALAAIFLSGSIVPIALMRAAAPTTVPATSFALPRIWREAPLGLAGSLAAGLAVGSVQSLGPQFAREVGLSIPRISQFMGALFLSGLLLQIPIGRLSDVVDRRKVLAVMCVVTAAGAIAVARASEQSFPLLLALTVLFGGSLATIYPLSVAHANDRLREESVVALSATLLLANGVGATAAPLLAALSMRSFGPEGLFHVTAAATLLLAVYAAFRMRRYAPALQDRFAAVAQTTPVVLELDPRAPTSTAEGEVGEVAEPERDLRHEDHDRRGDEEEGQERRRPAHDL